jgi:large subunit ribosomal protein L22
MATEIRATLSNCSFSAQKTRLVIDMIRGKKAVEALNVLKFSTRKVSLDVSKLLNSAISNAEENFGLNRDTLVIHTIMADEAPTRKWRRFGARGRFKPILRRSSHITVILKEKE